MDYDWWKRQLHKVADTTVDCLAAVTYFCVENACAVGAIIAVVADAITDSSWD